MSEPSRFEALLLPHLDAAYNLARWLARDPHDAEDVVQEACVRALRYLGAMRDGEARAWFLTIVRHACYDWLGRNRGDAADDAAVERAAETESEPPARAERRGEARALEQAIAALALPYREVIVLRELEELSYKEIAQRRRHSDRHRDVAPGAGARAAAALAGVARGRRPARWR